MQIDWMIVATIVGPILGAAAVVIYEHAVRPKLVYFITGISAFRKVHNDGEQNQSIEVNTHLLMLKNAGRKPSFNVRISHRILPDYMITPATKHNIEAVSDTFDIVISIIRPQELLTISYLYFPPLSCDAIDTIVKSDDGYCKKIEVTLVPQWSKPLLLFLWGLIIWGAFALLYIIILHYRLLFHV